MDVFRWLLDNFELFFFVNAIWVVSLLLARILVTASGLRLKESINRILYYGVVFGIICMTLTGGYVAWANHWPRQRPTANIAELVQPDTFWVESQFPVFFVSGGNLVQVRIDGTGFRYVFEGDSPIRHYQFSPDGRQVLVVTAEGLSWVNLKDGTKHIIDVLNLSGKSEAKGVIHHALWSPDSRKLFYTVSKWTPFSSLDQCYFFECLEGKKTMVKSGNCRPGQIRWDMNNEHLYFIQKIAASDQINEFRMSRVSRSSLTPESAGTYRSGETSLDRLDLKSMGIRLQRDPSGRMVNLNSQPALRDISDKRGKIGIHSNGQLFYERFGYRSKLFHVRGDGGKPTIKELRWIPGGRYVLMTHQNLGILVLEPMSGKVGHLGAGQGFGWYTP